MLFLGIHFLIVVYLFSLFIRTLSNNTSNPIKLCKFNLNNTWLVNSLTDRTQQYQWAWSLKMSKKCHVLCAYNGICKHRVVFSVCMWEHITSVSTEHWSIYTPPSGYTWLAHEGATHLNLCTFLQKQLNKMFHDGLICIIINMVLISVSVSVLMSTSMRRLIFFYPTTAHSFNDTFIQSCWPKAGSGFKPASHPGSRLSGVCMFSCCLSGFLLRWSSHSSIMYTKTKTVYCRLLTGFSKLHTDKNMNGWLYICISTIIDWQIAHAVPHLI